ncbi:hypothetical protein M3Y95_01087100 [Aphelenchoides besseyi]|nr:hypothetical protein M3Y95_01087100 [Aphelenchoides besseyi]
MVESKGQCLDRIDNFMIFLKWMGILTPCWAIFFIFCMLIYHSGTAIQFDKVVRPLRLRLKSSRPRAAEESRVYEMATAKESPILQTARELRKDTVDLVAMKMDRETKRTREHAEKTKAGAKKWAKKSRTDPHHSPLPVTPTGTHSELNLGLQHTQIDTLAMDKTQDESHFTKRRITRPMDTKKPKDKKNQTTKAHGLLKTAEEPKTPPHEVKTAGELEDNNKSGYFHAILTHFS